MTCETMEVTTALEIAVLERDYCAHCGAADERCEHGVRESDLHRKVDGNLRCTRYRSSAIWDEWRWCQ